MTSEHFPYCYDLLVNAEIAGNDSVYEGSKLQSQLLYPFESFCGFVNYQIAFRYQLVVLIKSTMNLCKYKLLRCFRLPLCNRNTIV